MPPTSSEDTAQSSVRTWQDIPRSVSARAPSSKSSRERKLNSFMHVGGALLGLCLLGCAVWAGWLLVHRKSAAVDTGNMTMAPRTIGFETDGVLTRDWFLKTYPEVSTRALMDIDLHALKEGLEFSGQIMEAKLSVKLPDQLMVDLRERQPVLRVRVAGSDQGTTIDLLVAEDGEVFDGQLYPKRTLERLPFLTGVKLVRVQGEKYQRVAGLPVVAELLNKTRERIPMLYGTYRTVSLKHFDGNPNAMESIIVVGSAFAQEIVFAPRNFDVQLEHLGEIVGYALDRGKGGFPLIDVSYENKAVIRGDIATARR